MTPREETLNGLPQVLIGGIRQSLIELSNHHLDHTSFNKPIQRAYAKSKLYSKRPSPRLRCMRAQWAYQNTKRNGGL